jgi:hypothetical protein
LVEPDVINKASSSASSASACVRHEGRAAPIGCYPLVMTNVAIEAMAQSK